MTPDRPVSTPESRAEALRAQRAALAAAHAVDGLTDSERTKRRQVAQQQLVTAKDELRRIVAALNYPATTEAKKRHLRLEWGRVDAERTRLLVELGRST